MTADATATTVDRDQPPDSDSVIDGGSGATGPVGAMMRHMARYLGGKSLGVSLDENRGIGAGFDWIRIIMTVMVVAWHAAATSYGYSFVVGTMINGRFRLLEACLVPIFFAMGGLLVTGSLVRVNNLPAFVMFRLLRVIPAMAVETLICAVFFGLTLSTQPVSEYLQSRGFFVYFGNIFGFIHYDLPGVFKTNPLPGVVNGSIWTIPIDYASYGFLTLIAACGMLRRPALFTVACAVISIGFSLYCMLTHLPSYPGQGTESLAMPYIVSCFFGGIILYVWRYKIPMNIILFVISVSAFTSVVYFAYAWSFSVGAISISYVASYIGVKKLPKIPLLSRGDYTYGVYVYHFPIQQAIVASFPKLIGFVPIFLISYPLALVLAVFSWHVVEKPILGLRRLFVSRSHLLPGRAV